MSAFTRRVSEPATMKDQSSGNRRNSHGAEALDTRSSFADLVRHDASHRKSLEHSNYLPPAYPASSRLSYPGSPPQFYHSSSAPQMHTYGYVEAIPAPATTPPFAAPEGSGSPARYTSPASVSAPSKGHVKSATKAIEEAEKTRKKVEKEAVRADRAQSKAEKKRIRAALKEQKHDPIHGDDLPHMPDTVASSTSPALNQQQQRGLAFGDQYTEFPTQRVTSKTTSSRPSGAYSERAEATPAALKGDNAILVDREIERLRDKQMKDVRMKWRIWTGTLSLIVMAFSTYFMARYITAWLNLAPSNVPLSDAKAGTTTSVDALVSTLCLIELSVAAASIACILAVIFYLRATRRRSCGLTFVWFCAILATTLQLALAVANMALIALWHKQYSSDSSSAEAATRDVGRRCAGTWDFDLLWNAAQASPNAAEPNTCQGGGQNTVKLFLMAGGIRLGLLVVFLTLWLIALARYNHTLEKGQQEIGSVEESAEMHRLLEEEMKHGLNVPGNFDAENEKTLTNADIQHYAEFVEERYIPEATYDMQEPTYASQPVEAHTRISSDRAPLIAAMDHAPPRLGRFGWQRGEPSMAGADYHSVPIAEHHAEADVHDMHDVGHGRDQSLLIRVWDSLWGTTAYPQADLHRNGSKLGVSGWFGREGTIGDGTPEDDLSRATSLRHGPRDVEQQEMREERSSQPASLARQESSGHRRTASQERRVHEGRHAAAAKAMAQAGHASADELPAMPELQSIPNHIPSNSTWGSDDSTDSYGGKGVHESQQNHAPQFVRTMGKLVRRLSAIESVGSAERERSDRGDRSQGSHLTNRSSLMSFGGAPAAGHAKHPSWNASHGTRLESTEEQPDEHIGSSVRGAPTLAPPGVPYKAHGAHREGSAASQDPFPGGWSGKWH